MLQNILTTSPAIWFGLAAGLFLLPILIHLINMMRHRRVKWAAMEFLLKSHKKHRNWVWLKQLLLLLSRIAAMLLALFTLGQIGCNNDSLSRFLGTTTTHHYVLLDDSFSMEDQTGQTAAFDRARQILALVAARTRNKQNQRFTLLRFSRADIKLDPNASPEEQSEQLSVVADINGRLVDSEFDNLLEDVRSKLECSQLPVGPMAALRTVEQLIASREKENAWVYVVSDFRNKDWDNQPELQQQLETVAQNTRALELVQCVKDDVENLAITALAADGSVRVAGIPLMMTVSVKNFGTKTASKVQVDVSTTAYDPTSSRPADSRANAEALPTVFIEEIKPGETETRRFPVFFTKTGPQVISAKLEKDAVTSDNSAWSVVDFKTSARVLVIENDARQGSVHLTRAISPGGLTGIAPEIQPKDYLRDTSLDVLSQFDVIYLLDVDRLDETAIKNLESFVNAGGGLGIFAGPYSNLVFYNEQLYREGSGLLPMPLDKVVDVPEILEEQVADIVPENHLFFKPVLAMKNSPLDLVEMKKIIRPPLEWSAKKPEDVEIAATVRGDKNWPLIATRNYGKGKVVQVLTTVDAQWHNWPRNGTFPPIMLIMEDWLASGSYSFTTHSVGQRIQVDFTPDSYQPKVMFTTPGNDPETRLLVNKSANKNSATEEMSVSIGGPTVSEQDEVRRPGIYEAWLTSDGNSYEARRFALNVDTSESQLEVMTRQKISKQFEASKAKISRWDQFSSDVQQNAASSLSKILLVILILILLFELILAYSCSYHPKRQAARA